MSLDELSVGESLLVERLIRFLRVVRTGCIPATLLYGGLAFALHSRSLAAACAMALAFLVGVDAAQRQLSRGRTRRAIGGLGALLLLFGAVNALLFPAHLPVLLVFPSAAVAAVTPHLRGGALRAFVGAAFADVAFMSAWALFGPDFSDVPLPVRPYLVFAQVLPCTGLLYFLLWLFGGHLRQHLDNALRANVELRASDERFRALAAATSQMLWSTDAEGRVVEDSPSWRAFTGQTFEEFRGLGWLSVVHPEDRARAEAAWHEAVARQDAYEVEYRVRRADGSWADTVARGTPVRDAQGRVREWMGSNRDITREKRAEAALRESEERSRGIISALAEGVLLQDVSGNVTLLNASAERLVRTLHEELPPGSELISRLQREDGSALLQEEFPSVRARRTGLSQENQVVGIVREEGAVTWLSINARPLFGPDGKPWAVVSSFFDITERKRAEEERSLLLERERKAREEAEAANRVKDEFLATVSHELRTPLTAILGWSKLLSSRRMPAERQLHAAEVIERNALAQKALVEDLLDVSRIVAGKLLLTLERVSLAEVVERAIEAVKPAAQAKEIRLEMVRAAPLGPLVGDPNRLQQVVWNLVSNAIKFTPRGGQVTVALSAHEALQVLEVRDTGEGIPPSFLPHVFERFRQADGSATRVHGGLGLGLAIVRHVVELHGGQVRAHSEGPGRGACFTVELPVSARGEGAEEAVALDLSGVRVLLVEAREDARRQLATSLEQLGANVRVAASAAEALEALEGFAPGVLVSELDAQEAGDALLRRAREKGGRLPAVALTGSADEGERARALAAGFEAHVAQPVDPQALAREVARLVRRD